MSQNNRLVLQKYLPLVIEELDTQNELNSCIFSCTVIQDILPELGIHDAYPLTVKPSILNPKLARDYGNNLNFSLVRNSDWEANGFAMIKFGQDEQNSEIWPAHLVTIIPNTFSGKAALLDITIMQANSEEFDIRLQPILTGVSEKFLLANEICRISINDCAIFYQAFPQDLSFKDTLIWKDRTKQKLTSQAILSRF